MRTFALIGLAAGHSVLVLAGYAAIHVDIVPFWCEDEFLRCFYALPFAQLSLLAMWLAWGSQRLVRRAAVAVPLAAVLWLGFLVLVFAVLPRYWLVWRSRAELVLFDVVGVPAVIGTLFWAANMTQIAVLLGSFAVVRLCGYRLVTRQTA